MPKLPFFIEQYDWYSLSTKPPSPEVWPEFAWIVSLQVNTYSSNLCSFKMCVFVIVLTMEGSGLTFIVLPGQIRISTFQHVPWMWGWFSNDSYVDPRMSAIRLCKARARRLTESAWVTQPKNPSIPGRSINVVLTHSKHGDSRPCTWSLKTFL